MWIEILAIVSAASLVAFTLIYNVRRVLKGKPSCSSGCGGCQYSKTCKKSSANDTQKKQ